MVDILSPGMSGSRTCFCNREDYGWRMRIRRVLERGMSLEEIAENPNHKGIRRPHGSATWSAISVRKRSSLDTTAARLIDLAGQLLDRVGGVEGQADEAERIAYRAPPRIVGLRGREALLVRIARIDEGAGRLAV
jgi:DNA-binding transcriptional MerR regulator